MPASEQEGRLRTLGFVCRAAAKLSVFMRERQVCTRKDGVHCTSTHTTAYTIQQDGEQNEVESCYLPTYRVLERNKCR